MESVKKNFREYKKTKDDLVYRHYQAMRKNQTLEYVKRMEQKWFVFTHAKLTIQAAFEKLGTYVDGSDPDTAFPNIEHSFQTA